MAGWPLGRAVWQRDHSRLRRAPACQPTHLGEFSSGGWAWACPRLAPSRPLPLGRSWTWSGRPSSWCTPSPRTWPSCPHGYPEKPPATTSSSTSTPMRETPSSLWVSGRCRAPTPMAGQEQGSPPMAGLLRAGSRGCPGPASLTPHPPSVHLLDAGVQVQHQGTHAVLQLQEPAPGLRGAGLPAGDLQEGGRHSPGLAPPGPGCLRPETGRVGAADACRMDEQTETQGVTACPRLFRRHLGKQIGVAQVCRTPGPVFLEGAFWVGAWEDTPGCGVPDRGWPACVGPHRWGDHCLAHAD